MRVRKTFFKSVFTGIFIGLFLTTASSAQSAAAKKTQMLLPLGDSAVKINVYEKNGDNSAKITFFAPHHNEQTGLKIVKEMIALKGGRLVEVEALDENGNPARRLKFSVKGKAYSLDPNRIFTENGRVCSEFTGEIDQAVKNFAAALLKIILARDTGNRLRDGEEFLVAVHNNGDVDAAGDKARDLTAHSFARRGTISSGAFYEQADGVYLSNQETDADNFIFLSSPAFLGFFAEKGFHLVVQKSAAALQSRNCGIDDGSLSVFAGQRDIPYINLEADINSGGSRQREMLEAVYELALKTVAPATKSKSEAAVEEVNKK